MVRIIDGDTYEMEFDLGFGIRTVQHIRLLGVDAPESWEPGGKEAYEAASKWFKDHFHGDDWPYVVITNKLRRTFDRYVGQVMCTKGHDLADALVEAGVAREAAYLSHVSSTAPTGYYVNQKAKLIHCGYGPEGRATYEECNIDQSKARRIAHTEVREYLARGFHRCGHCWPAEG